MIKINWRISWSLMERIYEIHETMTILYQQIDCITNITINQEKIQQYESFYDLPSKARKILNMDKQQLPSTKIRIGSITSTSHR